MKTSRRKFLRHMSLLTTAAAVRTGYADHDMHTAAQPGVALLDTNALARYVDPLPIPAVMRMSGLRRSPIHAASRIPYYRVPMRQFQARAHRDLPTATLWGYAGTCPGPTFEVRREQPILVEWANELPQRHFLPIDHTIHGAEKDKPEVRTVVHLHGGKTPPDSDGYPEDWFVPGRSATCYYPNQQEAATLFYHDHAMGITRLNAVAGLTGMYIIRDELEDSLRLPRGAHEIPLVLFDRSFRKDGEIYYPVSGNPGAPWVSEYYGSAILANGTIFPYLEVKPCKYRFRLLNASNGSFYRLSFCTDDSISSGGVEFVQIGSEQGFLETPAVMNTLVAGPGERADLVVDFSGHRGGHLFMRTDAVVFMQFRISPRTCEDSPELPATLRPRFRMPESSAVKTRELTIADYQDRLGRSSIMLLNGAHWDMPVTETPVLSSTEVWSFVNLTDDSHPIHLHMVRFQLLDRRPFDLAVYQLTGQIVFTGPVSSLPAGELGWKDTVRVDPLMVTRIIVKFEGFVGRYVWHCHMLEHEDNEMMRPYRVMPGSDLRLGGGA
ncbi:MAG: Multicopper oxidase [Gammaproteobacteria bacterium]|jgi:spore coat protein A|nr:Multicopper oxidase [Gammaproteobacteria bacterium]